MEVLIVVDMLNDFIKEDGALYGGPTVKAIVPAVKKVVEEFRASNSPIIWLKDSHTANDREFNRFPRHCVNGTEGADIIEELNGPKSYETRKNEFVVHKTRYSGFYNTPLDSILRELRLRSELTVHVVGVCTSICVMDTVGGLANRDYEIKVHADCVADFDQEMHKMALSRMEMLYGAELV